MDRFVEKYSAKLIGVMSGFDQLVLKGTLRLLSYVAGMMNFLYEKGVLLKDFGLYAQGVSDQLKEASQQAASRQDRPIAFSAPARRARSRLSGPSRSRKASRRG